MSDIKIQIPATFEMKVLVTNDETNQSGSVTIGINSLSFPTEHQIKDRISKFEETEMIDSFSGFRLMTAKESWDYTCIEKVGEVFAMPNKIEWYK